MHASGPQGRKNVAQGASPGARTPPTPFVPPPPRGRGRGQGGEGESVTPWLTPWAIFWRPCRGYPTNPNSHGQAPSDRGLFPSHALTNPRHKNRAAGGASTLCGTSTSRILRCVRNGDVAPTFRWADADLKVGATCSRKSRRGLGRRDHPLVPSSLRRGMGGGDVGWRMVAAATAFCDVCGGANREHTAACASKARRAGRMWPRARLVPMLSIGSPGIRTPPPPFNPPPPRGRGRGQGERAEFAHPPLTRWATFSRPCRGSIWTAGRHGWGFSNRGLLSCSRTHGQFKWRIDRGYQSLDVCDSIARFGGILARGSKELHKIFHRQFRVAQNLFEQPAADRLVVRDGDRFLSRTPQANVAPTLAHLQVADFGQHLEDRSARKNGKSVHGYKVMVWRLSSRGWYDASTSRLFFSSAIKWMTSRMFRSASSTVFPWL